MTPMARAQRVHELRVQRDRLNARISALVGGSEDDPRELFLDECEHWRTRAESLYRDPPAVKARRRGYLAHPR